MERDLKRCADMIHTGIRRLAVVDERLLYGDFEAAAEAIKFAWGAIVEPMSFLSEYWDGVFWTDWRHRDALFDNITQARELLKDIESIDFEKTLAELRDLMNANLFFLREAIDSLGADRGVFYHGQASAYRQ